MKLFAMTAALVTLSAPAFADSSAIERFNASKNNGDKIVSTAPSTRNGDSHSPKAQAIFDQIQAANAEDE
ncbi:hypothetical protein SAMN05444004_103285 [Jannaschia faecimaris]|uniref:DUF4148 domain-containing protein n=1 Tax=Jannaschia faecimaris TaxID=1244108 RepID=A0A1H3N657_9RHOB|nr:hypothetical protein [Jannaschia faecimaris]SDY84362.1 hypothetical protein SAMN05444004_103285 [Jannaschia faecimaris]